MNIYNKVTQDEKYRLGINYMFFGVGVGVVLLLCGNFTLLKDHF